MGGAVPRGALRAVASCGTLMTARLWSLGLLCRGMNCRVGRKARG